MFTRRKSLYFSFVAILLAALCLSPNKSEAQKFEVGLKAAGSFNNTYGQGTSSFLPVATFGGSFGGYTSFQLLQKLKIRGEVLVSTREFSSQYSSTGTPTPSLVTGSQPSLAPSSAVSTGPAGSFFATLSSQTVYLDIPLGVDYEIIPNLNLQGGAMFSIFLNEYSNSLSNSSTINLPAPSDSKYYQQYQFYLYAGAYYLIKYKVGVGARANLGLTNPFVTVGSGTGHQVYPYSYQIFVTYPLFRF
jgi:hypothetical protein